MDKEEFLKGLINYGKDKGFIEDKPEAGKTYTLVGSGKCIAAARAYWACRGGGYRDMIQLAVFVGILCVIWFFTRWLVLSVVILVLSYLIFFC